MAVYEITYYRHKISDEEYPSLMTSKNVVDFLKKYCYKKGDDWREHAFAIYTGNKNQVLGFLHLSTGCVDSCTLDRRVVLKGALDVQAKGIIITHNHPSGDPTPGKCDIENTNNLKNAINALGFEFLDHIIIGEKSFFSFAEERLVKK